MSKRPIHEVKLGLIKAVIWENSNKAGPRYSVGVTRLYRNGEVWVESSRFGRDDLLALAKAADMAHTWIVSHATPSGPASDGAAT